MLQSFKQLFNRPAPVELVPSLPEGQRVYAVGDIHGRLDLFGALAIAIEEDNARSSDAETTVILLGDLVDRGPDSKGVVELAREWQKRRNVRILGGNHEEMFLRSFDEVGVLRHFLRHGGRETVLSYGIDRAKFDEATLEEVQVLMQQAVPVEDIEFIAGFEDMVTLGDYCFVHAGIAPGMPLEDQDPRDLRWIRDPFLGHAESHGAVIVHGHTITPDAEDRGNRIGIDTGAFQSGRLTALVLEGTSRRYIETVQGEDGTIETRTPVV